MTTIDDVKALHKCPHPDCDAMVRQSLVACLRHWMTIPKEVRSRVWAGWRGNDPLRHAQALEDAISYLESTARGHDEDEAVEVGTEASLSDVTEANLPRNRR